jgi:hypothetical protein
LHAAKITTDENVIPVGKKTEGGEEILKEVTSFMQQKISETLPEPPVGAPIPEKTPIREMVALTTTSSQIIGHKTTEETGFDPAKSLFSYKKQEIKEFTMKVQNSSLEDVLMEYVRKTNGEIDLSRCSSELQTSNEEIERALESLGTKGKIKIELKSPE